MTTEPMPSGEFDTPLPAGETMRVRYSLEVAAKSTRSMTLAVRIATESMLEFNRVLARLQFRPRAFATCWRRDSTGCSARSSCATCATARAGS
ncbi:hypothetical protein ACQQ2N_12345 [Dokdonella sp. MW10]|uniref:hypothetical protein n=1 Tax=Dokdonella sp. MW10 TaxID=2992926 RepID=UPI003F806D46